MQVVEAQNLMFGACAGRVAGAGNRGPEPDEEGHWCAGHREERPLLHPPAGGAKVPDQDNQQHHQPEVELLLRGETRDFRPGSCEVRLETRQLPIMYCIGGHWSAVLLYLFIFQKLSVLIEMYFFVKYN